MCSGSASPDSGSARDFQLSNAIPADHPVPPDSIQSDTPLGVGGTGIGRDTTHPVGTYSRRIRAAAQAHSAASPDMGKMSGQLNRQPVHPQRNLRRACTRVMRLADFRPTRAQGAARGTVQQRIVMRWP